LFPLYPLSHPSSSPRHHILLEKEKTRKITIKKKGRK
jgi:hypothetical protein